MSTSTLHFMSNRAAAGRFGGVRLPLLLLLCCGCAGCGDAGAPVTVAGAVNYGGKPVEKGKISFEPVEGGGIGLDGEISNGRYVALGSSHVKPGAMRVRILAFRATGRTVQTPGGVTEEVEQYLPPGYNAETTLKVDLTNARKQTFDFDLKEGAAP